MLEELSENNYTQPLLAWLDAYPDRQLYLVQVGVLRSGACGACRVCPSDPARPPACWLTHSRGAPSPVCPNTVRKLTAAGAMEGVVADVKK